MARLCVALPDIFALEGEVADSDWRRLCPADADRGSEAGETPSSLDRASRLDSNVGKRFILVDMLLELLERLGDTSVCLSFPLSGIWT